MDSKADVFREKIIELVRQYYAAAFPEPAFVPGESPVRYAGRVFDADELTHLVEAALDFWLTTGRFADQFERRSFSVLRPQACCPG